MKIKTYPIIHHLALEHSFQLTLNKKQLLWHLTQWSSLCYSHTQRWPNNFKRQSLKYPLVDIKYTPKMYPTHTKAWIKVWLKVIDSHKSVNKSMNKSMTKNKRWAVGWPRESLESSICQQKDQKHIKQEAGSQACTPAHTTSWSSSQRLHENALHPHVP